MISGNIPVPTGNVKVRVPVLVVESDHLRGVIPGISGTGPASVPDAMGTARISDSLHACDGRDVVCSNHGIPIVSLQHNVNERGD